jgi:hypothetical protein
LIKSKKKKKTEKVGEIKAVDASRMNKTSNVRLSPVCPSLEVGISTWFLGTFWGRSRMSVEMSEFDSSVFLPTKNYLTSFISSIKLYLNRFQKILCYLCGVLISDRNIARHEKTKHKDII